MDKTTSKTVAKVPVRELELDCGAFSILDWKKLSRDGMEYHLYLLKMVERAHEERIAVDKDGTGLLVRVSERLGTGRFERLKHLPLLNRILEPLDTYLVHLVATPEEGSRLYGRISEQGHGEFFREREKAEKYFSDVLEKPENRFSIHFDDRSSHFNGDTVTAY